MGGGVRWEYYCCCCCFSASNWLSERTSAAAVSGYAAVVLYTTYLRRSSPTTTAVERRRLPVASAAKISPYHHYLLSLYLPPPPSFSRVICADIRSSGPGSGSYTMSRSLSTYFVLISNCQGLCSELSYPLQQQQAILKRCAEEGIHCRNYCSFFPSRLCGRGFRSKTKKIEEQQQQCCTFPPFF